MAVYRIYLVHDDGRLEPDESFYCKTDEDAPSPAETVLPTGHPVGTLAGRPVHRRGLSGPPARGAPPSRPLKPVRSPAGQCIVPATISSLLPSGS